MTAARRVTIKALNGAGIAAALVFATPAAAQNADAPIDVTAAPPPSAETVGPSQLRDFNLNGTVTRPADRPATASPEAPATNTPPSATPTEAAPVTTSAAPSAPRTAQPVPRSMTAAGRDSVQAAPASTFPDRFEPSAPTMPTDVAINSGSADYDDSAGFAPAPALEDGGGRPTWPWILALVALVGGIGFYARNRRSQRARYGDFGRLAFVAGGADAGDDIAPPPAAPKPKPSVPSPQPPRAQPTPPRAQPTPPRHDPTPAPARAPKSDGLIVSTRLKPSLQIEFTPDRAVVTERELMIQFDVVIVNSGSAPARDVLVEGRIVGAHAGQDQEIGEFFQNPVARGDRMAIIQPLGRIPLKTALRLSLDELKTFEVDGRKLFVPMVAFNMLYRAGSDEGQSSASFLVGRGGDEDEKLAPFRLDLGPRIFRGLSSRPHSMGLQR